MQTYPGRDTLINTLYWEIAFKLYYKVLCRDMDEPGNHHPQQTDTRTENQTPYILTHRQVLNNENTWTQGGEHHTLGSVGGEIGEGQLGVGSWGEIA